MATGVQVWSNTPVTNATIDSNVNFSEGMAPSQVNDSTRALMSSVAKWRDDNSGTLVTSGTTTALTLVTNQVEAALTSGYTVTVLWGATPDTAATLAVDGLAAVNIQPVYGTNITYGNLQAGQINSLTYTTGTGANPAWILKNFSYPLLSTGITTQASAWAPVFGSATNTLASSVALTTSMADVLTLTGLSSAGIYWVTGSLSFNGNAINNQALFRLWDGTTAVSESRISAAQASIPQGVALSGIVANPAGNIRYSGQMTAVQTGGVAVSAISTLTSTGKCGTYIAALRIG